MHSNSPLLLNSLYLAPFLDVGKMSKEDEAAAAILAGEAGSGGDSMDITSLAGTSSSNSGGGVDINPVTAGGGGEPLDLEAHILQITEKNQGEKLRTNKQWGPDRLFDMRYCIG